MRIRNVLEEFEARLFPTAASPSAKAEGKGEWKVYSGGERQCKVKVLNLNLANGMVLHIAIDGETVGEMVVEGNNARFKRESDQSEHVPMVSAGQVLQVLHDEHVILQGNFYSE
jgi:hypothetical protein